ncbi:metallophosphoesterase family protein [Aeromicrobium sp.]|uniref:metallophosphoesterase family protein n=1 Tax=Aeromicrobium sp. TaxID=1871063 RepID=UPI003C4ACB72
MVRVLAVADEEVPSVQSRVRDVRVDLVLAAGDLPWDYLESLVSLLGAPAAYVPGNHDPRTGHGVGPGGLVDVDGHVQTVGGLRIAGLGGCVRYNDGPHQYTQKEYDSRARVLLREARDAEVDVLLTHAPPLGLGDESDPPHVGISALHGVLETLRPSWHLHGHIHPYGMHKPDRQLGPTTIRNVIPWQLIDIEPRSAATATATAGRRA